MPVASHFRKVVSRIMSINKVDTHRANQLLAVRNSPVLSPHKLFSRTERFCTHVKQFSHLCSNCVNPHTLNPKPSTLPNPPPPLQAPDADCGYETVGICAPTRAGSGLDPATHLSVSVSVSVSLPFSLFLSLLHTHAQALRWFHECDPVRFEDLGFRFLGSELRF